jgi:3-isopropylmalate/(R)-2-methylmalate dehydratase small subunit
MSEILSVSGRGIPLRGNDIDTDRIMPARYLKVVSFEGLEKHVFEDDRRTNRGPHPFGDMRYQDAAILVVNSNFGCGSSREHAPQGLARFGIKAIVGESFSEIFLGNCSVLGVPCLTANHETIDTLQSLIEQSPETPIDVDVRTGRITAGSFTVNGSMPSAVRDAFVQGKWDPTMMLLDRFDEVRGVAKNLPYVAAFK